MKNKTNASEQLQNLIRKYKNFKKDQNSQESSNRTYLPKEITKKIKSGSKGYSKKQIREIFLHKKGTTIGF